MRRKEEVAELEASLNPELMTRCHDSYLKMLFYRQASKHARTAFKSSLPAATAAAIDDMHTACEESDKVDRKIEELEAKMDVKFDKLYGAIAAIAAGSGVTLPGGPTMSGCCCSCHHEPRSKRHGHGGDGHNHGHCSKDDKVGGAVDNAALLSLEADGSKHMHGNGGTHADGNGTTHLLGNGHAGPGHEEESGGVGLGNGSTVSAESRHTADSGGVGLGNGSIREGSDGTSGDSFDLSERMGTATLAQDDRDAALSNIVRPRRKAQGNGVGPLLEDVGGDEAPPVPAMDDERRAREFESQLGRGTVASSRLKPVDGPYCVC